MAWTTVGLALLVVLFGALQYGLIIYALRDLMRRPSVRGDNKPLWALVILILPVAGAVIYATIGPTSFIPRSERPSQPQAPPPVP